jgi:hypothetical protein
MVDNTWVTPLESLAQQRAKKDAFRLRVAKRISDEAKLKSREDKG